MEDTLISFETAKLAKEKGFDYPTVKHYDDNISDVIKEEEGWDYQIVRKLNGEPYLHPFNYPAPTQSLLQKWLREAHEIHAQVMCNHSGWFWDMEKTNGTSIQCQPDREPFYKTYEQALEKGLIEALTLTPSK